MFISSKHHHEASERSYLIGITAIGILKNLDFQKTDAYEKLMYAAVFHDLFIKEWSLSRIRSVQTSQFLNLNYNKKRMVLEHADQCSRAIEQKIFSDNDIADIVRQHHERPYGNGFPRGATTKTMTDLSKIFVVAHDYVDRLYDFDFDTMARDRIFNEIESNFNENDYSKIIFALKKTLQGF